MARRVLIRFAMRILVVDNDRDTADTISELLRERGHEVDVAYSGEQAAELIDLHVPDVALLDLAMPGMNGYELAAEIGGLPEPVRMFALSGLSGTMLAPAAQLAAVGIERCFTKGGNLDELIATIERAPADPRSRALARAVT